MSENKEDGSITASRNHHAQSKCHCASNGNSVTYPLQELRFIVLLFQENKSFGASCHLHSSSDVREAVSGTVLTTIKPVSNSLLSSVRALGKILFG
jgi:hypothetical protein